MPLNDDFIPDDEDEFAPEPHNEDQAMDAYVKGLHAYDNGDMDTARSFFQSSVTLNPKLVEAQRALERFTQKEPSKNTQSIENYRQGYEQFLKGNYPDARRSWESSLSADPAAYEARRGLQRLNMRKGL
jgi:tetratricopeptide (TPR) repeat protein